MRLRRIVLAAAGAILLGIAPAAAIETATFGIDVAEPTQDGRLHIEIKAGKTTRGELKVWNKTESPIALRFEVVPASVDEAGTADLSGDPEPVGWVEVTPERVELAPGAEQQIAVEVEAPRRLDGDTKTVAVMAEPDAAGGQAPAVLQRLAVTTFLEPDAESLIASLGVLPWVAAAILVLVAAAVARNTLKRRSSPTDA